MKISILTLFPEMFVGPFSQSIIKRAQEKNLVEITFVNIRDFGIGSHKSVDDKPYGGGTGMVLRVDVVDKAIQFAKGKVSDKGQKVILLDPRGQTFSQKKAQDFAKLNHLIFVCGHYEGFDERIRNVVDETISIGDFVVTGGEIPAMLISDAVIRLLPGVITEGATENESFSLTSETKQLLEYPQYTLPQAYHGEEVPAVLLSGNHNEIAKWRKQEAIKLTQKHRPDLL